MKKILSVLFSICLLFLIVCCDAESISETGLKLQKIKEFSVGYAHTASTANLDKAVDYAIATASVNNGILSPLGFEQLSVISSAVLAASESSADRAELEKIFNKKVEDPYPGLVTGNKPNIHKLFEIVDDLQAELINMIDSHSDSMDSDSYNAAMDFVNNVENVEKIAVKVLPAVDAIQLSLEQEYNRPYFSYGDYIAESLYVQTLVVSAVEVFKAEDRRAALFDALNNAAVAIKVIEVIYNVNFNFPQLAANFLTD